MKRNTHSVNFQAAQSPPNLMSTMVHKYSDTRDKYGKFVPYLRDK